MVARCAASSACSSQPLAPEAVRELVARPAGRRSSTEGDVADIVDRADGNAFFVEELVGAGGPAGSAAARRPGRRAAGPPRPARRARPASWCARPASAAARCPTGCWRRCPGMPAEALDEAPAAGGRRARPGHRGTHGYAFRHALLGEAVYDDLLPGERVRLHAAYVEALRTGRAAGTAAELARHARPRWTSTRRSPPASRPATDARAVGGPDEAAHHFQQALELLADPRRRPAGRRGPLQARRPGGRGAQRPAAARAAAAALLREQLAGCSARTPRSTRGPGCCRPGPTRCWSSSPTRTRWRCPRAGGASCCRGRGQRPACAGARRARPHPGLHRPLRGGAGGRPGRARPGRAAGPVGRW